MKEEKLIPKRRFEEFANAEAWEQRKLGDILKYEQPTKYIVESTDYDDRYLTPVLTAGQSFILGYSNENFGVKNASEDEPVIIFDDFTTSSHYVDFPFKVKSSAMKLLELTDEKYNFYFIYESLKNINYTPKSHERHWISKFSGFKISLPNYKEQTKIGNFFTSLDKLITLHQRKLKKLKETKSAYLSEMFPKEGKKYPQRRFASFTDPWEQRKLGELNFTISDGNYGELYPKSNELLSEGVPFIRVNNIINGYLVHKDLVYISPKLHAVLKSGHLKEDDILITTRGEIGKIALVDNRFEDANINAQICLIRTDNKMESRYLHQYLQTDFSQKEIISFQTGSALKQLPKNRLDDITIVYPIQKEEQVKVGAFFEKLDNLITLHQHKLEKLKNIKKAYLNEMFV